MNPSSASFLILSRVRHMQEQSKGLRLDMKAERDAGQAVQLLAEVTESDLKARLQAP